MKNNFTFKSLKKVLILLVVVLVIVSAIETFKEYVNEYDTSSTIKLIGVAFSCLFVGVAKNIFVVAAISAFLIAIKSYDEKKLDETDFEKNKKYYRDIIDNYSVSVLNYIDNFKLDYKQSYTAKLLELQNKKIIKIDNG